MLAQLINEDGTVVPGHPIYKIVTIKIADDGIHNLVVTKKVGDNQEILMALAAKDEIMVLLP